MKLLHLACAAAMLCSLACVRLQAYPLWGRLQTGPHAVGYQTIFTYDRSRPTITEPDGTPSLAAVAEGRQMQLSVWYPARALRRSAHMLFEEYLFLSARELDFSPLTEEKRQQVKKSFMEGPLMQGASAERLAALLRTETAATRNAPPARGRFPLIIFAHGSPPTQSVMCEYLASQGFVVAAVPSKGSFEYAFDVGLSGLETLIKDMEFVLAYARNLPQVDGHGPGLIGMSFGSAGVIGLQTRNPEVRAMVSLDGGIGEGGVSFLLTRTPYYEISRIKAPLLHLYTPNNPYLDLSRMESYKYSTRYFVQVPRMRHGDFVAYGMLEQIVPKMYGDAPGDAQSGFEWTCRYTLHFLQAYLKGDREARDFLERTPETNGTPKDLLSVSVKTALTAPPSVRELKAIFERDGIKNLETLYAARKKQDAQPFTYASLIELSNWLLARQQYDAGKVICNLFLDSYPNSVRAHFALARLAAQTSDRELARTHFTEMLRLINDDPELDYLSRKRLEQAAKEGLARLS